MSKWDEFNGCMLLKVNDMIDFILYLENSERMKTEEGKFLHYQYVRELRSQQSIGNGRLHPENGTLNYYNIDNLQEKLKWMRENLRRWSRMAITPMERSINVVKNMYNENWYSETYLSDLYTNETIEGGFKGIVDILVDKKIGLLLSNHDILKKQFSDEVFIKKNGKTLAPSVYELLAGWCNDDYQVDNIYVYQATVLSPLSFKFDWKGYNTVTKRIEEGKSTINSMRWLNI